MRYLIIFVSASMLFASPGICAVQSFSLNGGNSGIDIIDAQQNRTVMNLKISEFELKQTATDGEAPYKLSLPDEFSSSAGAILGADNVLLPTVTRYIAIPFDSDPQINVLKSSYKEIDDMSLAPAAKEDMESYFLENRTPEISSLDGIVEGKVAGVMRDIRVYAITFTPFNYDPENSRLTVYDDIEIRIDHAGSQITRYDSQISEAFEPLYRTFIDNPDVFDPIKMTRGAYWIIYPDAFATQLLPFAEWKHHKGFSVEMIAKSDIGSNPSYLTIKNYIQARFDTCQIKPDYIAIIGDVVMPSNLGIPTKNYSNPYGMGDIESDNYYTFVEGNDYFPDIYIGRISIDYVNDLTNYLNKFFSYERTPYMDQTAWYLRATMVAGGDNGYFVSPRITKLYCADRMRDVGFTNIDTLFDSYSHPIYAYEVNNSINSGVSYVNYRGYGDPSGWTPPYYTSSDLNSLYNGPKYAIMTSIVCGTGDYNDGWVDICFGETWIRLSGKGGPGFIGNSNHDAHTAWTNAIDCGIYWGWFVKNAVSLAQGQLMGKMELWRSFPNDTYPGGQVELYFNSYNILGDPELNCWTQIPSPMTVTYQDSMQFGQNLISVQVEDGGGNPLEGAYVCVTNDNDVFAGGFVPSDGLINFDVSPANSGDLYVTVTDRNFIPHEGTVTMYNSDVAVAYSSHVVDDDNTGESSGNGDGALNPSETIELQVSLRNFGQSLAADAVSAVLSCDSPEVSITRNSANFGDIAPGETGTSDQPYLVNISSNAFNGSTVDLVLDISDNGGDSWSSIIRLPIEAAQFDIDQVTILDSGNGQLDPGEIVQMYLSATNSGLNDVTGATAVLRTADEQVSIYDSTAVFGDCAHGGSFDNSGDTFMLSVDSGTYVGHIINFSIVFTGDGPQEVTASFNQTVGTVSSDDPIGPDSYGYYCFDNTDVGYADRPEYEWVDIDTQNWPYVQTQDDDVSYLALPFPVSYYGQIYDEVSVCDNGFIAFGHSWWNAWQNTAIPGAQNAAAMISPFWDDLKYSSYSSMGPRVYYYYDDTHGRYILAYNNAWADDVGRNETFEIIILDRYAWPTVTSDNEIIFQYNDVNNPYSTSVGICSPDRQDGLGYLFNNSYSPGAATLTDGRALKFTTGSLYTTGINDNNEPIPESFSLAQSYPNPFNPSATIEFSIPAPENVKLEIFNLLGQKITDLVDSRLDAGVHSVVWNAENYPSGVYFYRLKAGNFEDTKRMTLLK